MEINKYEANPLFFSKPIIGFHCPYKIGFIFHIFSFGSRLWEPAGIFYRLRDKKHAGEVYAVWRANLVSTSSSIAIELKTLLESHGSSRAI